ncbi:MAG: protein kinase [Planctomycetes bacterium]|nr:protein kinase [Planctomycetota bacterium]
MMLDARIADLLLRWEELRARGQLITPEELCGDCPDLLEEVVKGIRAVQTIHTLYGTPQEAVGSAAPAPMQVTGPGLPAVGDYQVLGELGRGGMGVVYQAYDRKRQEMVALKTLQRLDPSSLYRLKQEFRALAEVSHPNLVKLHELISSGHQIFIAMELIDGDHFLAYLRSGGGTPSHQTIDFVPSHRDAAAGLVQETVDAAIKPATSYALSPLQYDRLRAALRQLAQGILALHALGKLHRDIKPSNVMVTREGRVVLMDFGLAAELDYAGLHQSTEQHVTGTIAYMAPEQAASQAQSPASDWYSVGVMLFEALTGRLPFIGTPFQVLMDKQQRIAPAPSEIAPGLPEDLESLCVALLSRAPESRPSGPEVVQRLADNLAAEETLRVRPTPAQKASFVGREVNLASLNQAFQAMRKGHATVVRLQGRSGAGKSVLAQHFLDSLMRRGEAVVLAGKCYERESVPYKALDSLIDALSRYLRRLPTLAAQALLPREVHLLARVFPVLQRVAAVMEAPGRAAEIVDPHEVRRRAFAALRELLARLSDRNPLVLFIDDLQWGDLDGATQLTELLRPPEAPAVMLLACYRSEDADTSPCLGILQRALERAGPALDQRQLVVEPLSHYEARELALALLGRRDSASEAQADTIARESGGNPFFVQVLVQCVGASVTVAESPAAGALALDEVLWARIQTLPDEPRRLLEVIAVSGQPLKRADARQAAGFIADEQGALAALRSGRLIRSSGSVDLEEVETYHDRVRETILSHLPGDVVMDLHCRIAVVLESATAAANPGGAPLAVAPSSTTATSAREESGALKTPTSKRVFDLAYHFDAAGDSERAFPYALAMADQAREQYALEIAEQLYRIAERGAEKMDNATRHRVAESLGDVLMLRGKYPEAALRFKAVLALTTDAFTQAQIEGKLGELAFKCGDMKTAIEAIERALRMLGNRVPRWSVSFLFGLLRETVVQVFHSLLPRLFLARKQQDGAENQLLTIRLHNRLTYPYWFGGGKVPCLWTHMRGLNLAERFPATKELAHAYSIHAPVMSLLPYFSRGIAYAEKSFAIYQALGDLWGQGQALHFYGVVLYAASRFTDCVERCRESVKLLERAGDSWEVNIARYQTAASLYRLGDLRGAVAEAKWIHQSGLEIGDIQSSGISLDVWVRAAPGEVATDAVQTELQRPRHDPQASAQVLLAEGVRLFYLARPEEAANVFEKARQIAAGADIKNTYVAPILPWLATALRRQAEQMPDVHSGDRVALLKRAGKIAGQALRTARAFQNDLPHALRERGLIAALQGRPGKARQDLDESLAVAERQQARFEHAQSMLARGRLGQQYGWPDAERDLMTARQALASLGADFALDQAPTS